MLIQPNSLSMELEITSLVHKSNKLDDLLTSIKSQYSDRIISVCDFLFFLIQNELISENKTLFVIFALFKLCLDNSLNNYFIEFANHVKETKSHLNKLALYNVVSESKLLQFLTLDADSLRMLLEKIHNQKKLSDLNKKITLELAKLIPIGPTPPLFNFQFECAFPIIFDNSDAATDSIRAFNLLSSDLDKVLEPEFLLPLPTAVDLSADELRTPFPLFLETPILNPDLPHSAIVSQILRSAAKASEADVSVS